MDKTIRKAGFHFARGVLECVCLFVIIGSVALFLFTPKDDCDKSYFDRCGMKVVTDSKTGKQYLLSPHGGIIERPTTNKEDL